MRINPQEKIIILLYALYPLVLFRKAWIGVSVQVVSLCILTAIIMVYAGTAIWKKQLYPRPPQTICDLMVIGIVIYQGFCIAVKLSHDTIEASYHTELCILSFAALYWLLSSKINFRLWFLDIIIYSGLINFSGLLYSFIGDIQFSRYMGILTEDSHSAASYILLVCICGIWQYCFCGERLKSVFYLSVCILGFFLLAVNHNIISLWMLAAFLIAIPIVIRPTAILVKRSMQLLYIYLFLLGNIGLLNNYTSIIQKKQEMPLINSMYINLLLVVSGYILSCFWRRIPKEIDLRRLVLRYFRKYCIFVIGIIGMIFLVMTGGGEKWENLPDSMGLSVVINLNAYITEESRLGGSVIYECFEQQGLIGGGFVIILLVLFIIRIHKRFHFAKPLTGMLILVSDVLFIQLLIGNPLINTLPVYFTFLFYALFMEEKKQMIHCRKISDKEENGD